MTKERYIIAKKITLWGGFFNIFLGVFKIIGGILYQSHALIADGLHSLSDLLADIMVIIASKWGSESADDSHPYGHQRIETAATLLLSALLLLTGFGIIWDASTHIVQRHTPTTHFLALPIAIASLLIKEGLFQVTRHIGKKITSELLLASAWHHRSDAAASAVVIIGIIGSLLGYSVFDPLAAVIVGCMIIKMGLSYGLSSVKELVDTAVPIEQVQQIKKIIRSISGVKKIHQLRTRLMAGDIFVDVHVLVSPFISVSEGHFIAQSVHHALMKKIMRIKDVTVHIDPEDDEENDPSLNLPSRHELEKIALLEWQKIYPALKEWTIHYLDGNVRIDLYYTAVDEKTLHLLQQRILNDMSSFTMIKQVNLLHLQSVI